MLDTSHVSDVEVSMLLQCEGLSSAELATLLAGVGEIVRQWKLRAKGSVRLMHADSDQPHTLFSMTNE